MPTCCIPNCSNRPERTTNISYYEFPKDIYWKMKWITAIRQFFRKDNWTPTPSSRICSWHFPNGKEFGPSRFKRNNDKPFGNIISQPSVKCCVENCSYDSKFTVTAAYKFPTEPIDRELWRSALPNYIQHISSNMVICGKHWPANTPFIYCGRRFYKRPRDPPSIFPDSANSFLPKFGVDLEPPELEIDLTQILPAAVRKSFPSTSQNSNIICYWKQPNEMISCFRKFLTLRELHDHIVGEHILPFGSLTVCYWENCSHRGEDFKLQVFLLQHVQVHADSLPIESLSYEDYSILHSCLSSDGGYYQCKDCHRRYHRSSDFTRHIKQHTHYEISNRVCLWKLDGKAGKVICNFQSLSWMEIVEHVNSIHLLPDDGAGEIICQWKGCKRSNAVLRSRFIEHLGSHDNANPVNNDVQNKPPNRSLITTLTIEKKQNEKVEKLVHASEEEHSLVSTMLPKSSLKENECTNNGAFVCKECKEVFQRSGDLTKHMKQHTHNQIFNRVCLWGIDGKNDGLYCKFESWSWVELVRHVYSKHLPLDTSQPVICYWKGCPRDTAVLRCRFFEHLGTHDVMVPSQNQNKDDIISIKSEETEEAPSVKEKSLPESKEKRYVPCSICSRKVHESGYTRHIRNHAHNRYTRRTCLWIINDHHICKFTTSNWSLLVNHIILHHLPSQSPIFCKWRNCNKVRPFNRRYFLQHLACHDTAFKFKCHHLKCERVFPNRLQLKCHMRNHLKDQLSCMWLENQKIICNKKLSDPLALHYHLRQHIDSEQMTEFKCYWAGCPNEGSILNKIDLLKHLKIHVDERNKACIFVQPDTIKPKENFSQLWNKIKKAEGNFGTVQSTDKNPIKNQWGTEIISDPVIAPTDETIPMHLERAKIFDDIMTSTDFHFMLEPIIDFPDEIGIKPY